ncbi:MAG: NAD(P)H-dependent oxidoreductase [Saprospiraceae bacterium]|nr:NAD(P)H-dependent oxidoreductase [Saprospiraceae bacterium]
MKEKKILVFGSSNSKQSINRQLAIFASTLLQHSGSSIIDMNDFEMPIYGIDREKEEGIPQLAYDFREMVETHDGMIISMAEHNGAYTTIFKNIFDWISRIPGSTWGDKPMLLLGTSPGGRGASSVLEIASKRLPFNGGFVKDTFSLPLFNENFDRESQRVTNEDKLVELTEKVQIFERGLEG